MNITFSYKDISTYRSELMGIAMIWIMMIHFDFTQIKPLGFISQFGFIGPDLFLFVSGFGLYHSLTHDHNIIYFFKKRIIRIFPTYYLFGIISSLAFYHDSLGDYLFRYSTIGYWTGDIYRDWYIPSAIMCYLWAPVIKLLLDKRKYFFLGLFFVSVVVAAFILVDKNTIIDRSHFSFLHRIPSFIFGIICAYWKFSKQKISYYLISIIVCLPIVIFLYPKHHVIYNYKDFAITYMLPIIVLFSIVIVKYTNRSTYFSKIGNASLSKIGNASLEIYLIQGLFFHAILTNMINVPQNWHDVFTILFIITSSILGITAHWLIDRSGINKLL